MHVFLGVNLFLFESVHRTQGPSFFTANRVPQLHKFGLIGVANEASGIAAKTVR